MSLVKPRSIPFYNGSAESKIIDAAEYIPSILIFPSTFAGTALTVEIIAEDGSANPLYDKDGDEISIFAGAEKSVALDIVDLVGVSKFRFVSNSAQTADIEVEMISRLLR